MSMSRQMNRMEIGGEKRRCFSSDEDEPERAAKKAGTAAAYPVQQITELQYQLGRAGSALKAANKVSMSIGWGPIIPQTPAPHSANRMVKPFSPMVGGVTPVRGGGVTPVHGSGVEDNVMISRQEYDRLLRNTEKRNREREEGEKDRRRNASNDREEERRRDGNDGRQVWRRQGDPQRRFSGAGREKGSWGMETGYDEMRHLEGLCGRCGEDHATRECIYNKEELRCDYKPCISKQGHTIKVCHEIMKRCRLPVCEGQRGHRVKSHFRPDGVIPLGKDGRSARELRRHFEEASVHLTGTEMRLIQRYERRQERPSSEGGSSGKARGAERRGQDEEEGIEMTVYKGPEVDNEVIDM